MTSLPEGAPARRCPGASPRKRALPTTVSSLALLAVSGLSACQSGAQPAHPPQPHAPCRAEAAQALAGRARISDAEAKQLTGASIVRQVAPGQPVTMDFRPDRVTIETDPATGRIVRASCG
jgi:hypothetical protein